MDEGGALGAGSRSARWRTRAADVVWAAHTAVLAFFAIAWALPWRATLWAAVIGAFVMRVQWWLNDGICLLTKLERVLRGLSPVPAADEGGFIADLAAAIVGRRIAKRWTNRATEMVLWGGAGIAAARLAGS